MILLMLVTALRPSCCDTLSFLHSSLESCYFIKTTKFIHFVPFDDLSHVNDAAGRHLHPLKLHLSCIIRVLGWNFSLYSIWSLLLAVTVDYSWTGLLHCMDWCLFSCWISGGPQVYACIFIPLRYSAALYQQTSSAWRMRREREEGGKGQGRSLQIDSVAKESLKKGTVTFQVVLVFRLLH